MKRIDLCQYAASRGFVLDRKLSSRCSFVMRHTNGDKLIVRKTSSGHYIYFNAKGNDNGSIIDFIQTRDRATLGDVRKMLRPWLNGTLAPIAELPTLPITLQPSEHDAARVLGEWMKAQPLNKTHPYLEYERKIPRDILTSPLLRDRIRIDKRMNAVFPHFNQSGLCGFEVKNKGWTGFSPGGLKGLACSRPHSDDREMIICETAIDMLSYAAVRGIDRKRLFSTAGQISPMQAECLRNAARKLPVDATVVLALDNDEAGHKLADQITDVLSDSGREIRTDFPSLSGGDWNDEIRQNTSSQPCIPVSP